jgi:hypothetical protein
MVPLTFAMSSVVSQDWLSVGHDCSAPSHRSVGFSSLEDGCHSPCRKLFFRRIAPSHRSVGFSSLEDGCHSPCRKLFFRRTAPSHRSVGFSSLEDGCHSPCRKLFFRRIASRWCRDTKSYIAVLQPNRCWAIIPRGRDKALDTFWQAVSGH